MQSIPQLKRLEDFELPKYQNSCPQPKGVRRYHVHKNFVSSEYALAQDDYSNYLKRILKLDSSPTPSLSYRSPTHMSTQSTTTDDYYKNEIPTRSVSSLEKPVTIIKVKDSGIQTEIFEQKNESSSDEEEEYRERLSRIRESRSLNQLPNINTQEPPSKLLQPHLNLSSPVRTPYSNTMNPYATPKNINPFIDYGKLPAFQQPLYSHNHPKLHPDNPIVGYGRDAYKYTPRKMSNFGTMMVKPNSFR
ncbi:unnamed protein product [Blepharisma stoltei]|uniref:Uncharacterized protein n=1 Tax=Blepharisma stoltei TaxID=1481888 RepID=A0AAU9KJ95_9CILI|nr:unnamed protein product [Blepharisma stoltei]